MSDLLEIAALAPVLVVAPHPDDETLGAGGLIASCAALGLDVRIITVTDGEASHAPTPRWPAERLARVRRAEQLEALRRLGLERPCPTFLGLPDGHVRAHAGTLDSALARSLRGARSVFVTASDDEHPDHRACGHAVARASRTRPDLRVFFYQVWPAKAASPRATVYLSLGDMAPRKHHAICAHRSQRGEAGHDDPTGFVMPAELIARASEDHERYQVFTR